MNELRRMAYLDALGIDAYVSRGQLPGAAVTQRLAIVPSQSRPASPVTSGVVIEDEPASAALRELESRPVAAQVPHIDSAPRSPSSPVAWHAHCQNRLLRLVRLVEFSDHRGANKLTSEKTHHQIAIPYHLTDGSINGHTYLNIGRI